MPTEAYIFIFSGVVIFIGLYFLISTCWNRFDLDILTGFKGADFTQTSCVCCGNCRNCSGSGSCFDICCETACDGTDSSNANRASLNARQSISQTGLMRFLSGTALGQRLGVSTTSDSHRPRQLPRSRGGRKFKPNVLDRFLELRRPEQQAKYFGVRGTLPPKRKWKSRARPLLTSSSSSTSPSSSSSALALSLVPRVRPLTFNPDDATQQRIPAPYLSSPAFYPPMDRDPHLNRALIVAPGYKEWGSPYSLGNNPLNDATAIRDIICKYLCMLDNVVTLTDDTTVKPTYANITASMQWLTTKPQRGQRFYFHFSGHCQQINANRREKFADNYSRLKDDALLSLDLKDIDSHFMWNTLVLPLKNSHASLLATVDACQCGTCFALPMNFRCNATRSRLVPVKGAGKVKEHDILPNCTILLFSACTDQQSASNGGSATSFLGAATNALKDSLRINGPSASFERIVLDAQRRLDETTGGIQDIQISSMNKFDVTLPFGMFGICDE